jgi:hypothetical protein
LICDFVFSSRLSVSEKEATAESGPPKSKIKNRKSKMRMTPVARSEALGAGVASEATRIVV